VSRTSRNELNEKLLMNLRYSAAKRRAKVVVDDPFACVLVPSTPSTDAHALPSGSSVLEGTSHKVQTGHKADYPPLDEEGSGDMGTSGLEYAGQPIHLPATCNPMHIGLEARD
jgi:hypothetical protein